MLDGLFKLDRAHADALAGVLSRAFIEDPMFAYLVPDIEERRGVLSVVFRHIAGASLASRGVWATSENLEGCIIVSGPSGERRSPASFAARAQALLLPFRISRHTSLRGYLKKARSLRESMSETRKCIRSFEPCLNIHAIAVEERHRGRGHMSRMMRAALAGADRAGVRCVLETESETNVSIYRHFGFAAAREIPAVPGGFACHIMVREPPGIPNGAERGAGEGHER